MNKQIDFTQNGGMPLTQDLLKFMQDATAESIQGIISLFGDNIVVSGVAFNGSSFPNGWVIYDGELLPFMGGSPSFSTTPSSQIISVFETGTQLIFSDGTQKTVKFLRYVGLGNAGQNAKTIGDLMFLSTYKKVSQTLFKSGSIDITAVGTISISLGQSLDVTKFNPVVAIHKTNNALPNKHNIFTGLNNVISAIYFEQTGTGWFLKIENNIDAQDLAENSPKLVYHIFKDISSL